MHLYELNPAEDHFAFSLSLQNLNQNPRTLLPKFFGLYCVQSGGKNIRVVVMNNVLPRVVRMHLKYDLKGSTYKRRASKKEREKARPTFKDLDFMQNLQEGLMLDQDTYSALVKTLQRDCLVSWMEGYAAALLLDVEIDGRGRLSGNTCKYRVRTVVENLEKSWNFFNGYFQAWKRHKK